MCFILHGLSCAEVVQQCLNTAADVIMFGQVTVTLCTFHIRMSVEYITGIRQACASSNSFHLTISDISLLKTSNSMGEVVNVLVAFAVIVFLFRWATSSKSPQDIFPVQCADTFCHSIWYFHRQPAYWQECCGCTRF